MKKTRGQKSHATVPLKHLKLFMKIKILQFLSLNSKTYPIVNVNRCRFDNLLHLISQKAGAHSSNHTSVPTSFNVMKACKTPMECGWGSYTQHPIMEGVSHSPKTEGSVALPSIQS